MVSLIDDVATGPAPLTRRAVISASVKLAYAAPVIAGSFHLSMLGARAEALLSGIVQETTCTPTPPGNRSPTPTSDPDSTPTPTPDTDSTPTPTPGSTLSPTPTSTPGGGNPPVTDTDDKDDLLEILSIKFLPETGDGGSLAPSCT